MADRTWLTDHGRPTMADRCKPELRCRAAEDAAGSPAAGRGVPVWQLLRSFPARAEQLGAAGAALLDRRVAATNRKTQKHLVSQTLVIYRLLW